MLTFHKHLLISTIIYPQFIEINVIIKYNSKALSQHIIYNRKKLILPPQVYSHFLDLGDC